jgi:DNA-binding NarL/FixJ family response regulator
MGDADAAGSAGIRVLIADDDASFCNSLRALIERQPELTVVAVAGDGLRAIELVERLEPDAAVLDLHMPLLDGVTAVTKLRRDYPSLCLIALTGDDAPELHEAVRDAGADAVLLKSAFVDTLVERLGAVRATA